MTCISDMTTPYSLYRQSRTADGLGGYTSVWQDLGGGHCRFAPSSSQQFEEGDELVPGQRSTAHVRSMLDIREDDIMSIEGIEYDVIGLDPAPRSAFRRLFLRRNRHASRV